MYELLQLTEKTYYMDCPAKVGFYKVSENEVVLIDSGSDRDAAKKVKKILDEKGWKLTDIFNTHSHADHIGGNNYLQEQTGCKIYAKGIEHCFTEKTILEPTFLYGGYAMENLHNKFLMAKESVVSELTDEVLPTGLTVISLPGHSYDMVGFQTDDDVVFLADCLSGNEILDKYGISYLYDVKSFIDTLERIKELKAKFFVPSHAKASEDIRKLAQLNIDKTKEVADRIESLLTVPKSFETLLTEVFDVYQLTMTLQQYVLIGSTLKSYLTYLLEEGRAEFFFDKNRMLWRAIIEENQ